MRIFLTESGGVVGLPIRYEVDESALDGADLSTLEEVIATAAVGPRPVPTSAGECCIRVERDDGSISEITLSHAAPAPEIAELVQRLRSFAKVVHER
jgi:hypothetical protein